MKLITFQTMQAYNTLCETGVLRTSSQFVDIKKYGIPYDFIIHMMNERGILSTNREDFPLWAWKKCQNHICPSRVFNKKGIKKNKLVKITFSKTDNEVLVSDYMAYSFILNGQIVPQTQEEYKNFLERVKDIPLEELKLFIRGEKVAHFLQIKELFPEIKSTWRNILDLKSNIHQACVWDVKLQEVEKIESCDNPLFIYGTLNYIRSNGSRPNWIKKYLDILDC